MTFPAAVALLSLLSGFCGAAGVEEEAARIVREAAALKDGAGPPRMLVVGDSHTEGVFGRTLYDKLHDAYPGWRIEVYAECGSSPLWFLPDNPASGHVSGCGTWFHRYTGRPPVAQDVTTPAATPMIADLLKPAPAVVVVALGANMADWDTGGIFDMKPAAALAGLVKGSKARCVWIGPPNALGHLSADAAAAQVARLNALLRAAVGGDCAYLESSASCHGPPGGYHCAGSVARAWGEAAAQSVRGALALPAP